MNTEKIFKYLESFVGFPTYQLERRIDAFMLPYLEQAFKNKTNDDVVFVYPEFPLKRLTGSNIGITDKVDKLSEYADYLLWSPSLNTVYLVEFKTEVNSLKESQFNNYYLNCTIGWKELLIYYFDKAIGNQKNWKKFANGLIHLEKTAPELLGLNKKLEIGKFLHNKSGVGIHQKLEEIKLSIHFSKEPVVKFIYLLPESGKEKLESYTSNNNDYTNFYIGYYTLKEFAVYSGEPLKTFLNSINK